MVMTEIIILILALVVIVLYQTIQINRLKRDIRNIYKHHFFLALMLKSVVTDEPTNIAELLKENLK